MPGLGTSGRVAGGEALRAGEEDLVEGAEGEEALVGAVAGSLGTLLDARILFHRVSDSRIR